MRKWGRRFPRVSRQPSPIAAGVGGSVVATDPGAPPSYTNLWLDLKELFFRVWQLETFPPLGQVVPSSMFNGKPTASLCLLRWPSTETFTFPVGLVGSKGIARTAATAQTDCDVQINAVSFGTMRWAAAGTVATFISAAGSAVVPGDVIEVFATATPDATLANIGFGLRGLR